MPHFIVEYSANLEKALDMSGLCETIRACAAGIDTFPTPGIRVRAFRCDHYAIANGDPKHGFIDISIRLRGGRPDDVKKAATEQIFKAARAFVQPVMDTRPIALSLEMRDIDPNLSPKAGSIRDHL
ncbi:5-carboxymethyl-2-hydroxymuconate Delta-isomerase [Shimia sp.]|uniref:5-carboxymethyl-2-hydroxymuconate Delta-isomerase n=1 Tax=Shimia sp. TaxID=1954381 RepID=UPI003297A185